MKIASFYILSLVFASTMMKAQISSHSDHAPCIVIHGGAGTILKKNMTSELEQAYREKLEESLRGGYAVLDSGGSSVEAVEAAIRIMEDSPLFNAGKGSVFTNQGTNEMDASIMDGKTLNAGAVAGVRLIKNPISGARLVMTESPHVMLCGEGAEQFARHKGLEMAAPSYFRTNTRYEQWQRMRRHEQNLDHDNGPGEKEDKSSHRDGMPTGQIDPSENEFNVNIDLNKEFGTVGCVAIDRHGNIAAGTSTGGMTNKRWGRIGDSPIIGAGTYADNRSCGISCTGHGEYFMRLAVAHEVSALMRLKGYGLQEALNEVLMKELSDLGGTGGAIAIDKDGNICWAFNTAGMYRASIDTKGEVVIQIYGSNAGRGGE